MRTTTGERGFGLITLLVVMAVAAGVGYFVATRNISTASTGDTVREVLDTAKSTSLDAGTTAKVKTALALSKRVSSLAIKVSSTDQVVTLTGDVPTDEMRIVAGQIAGDTVGVKDVRNELHVTSR